MAKKKNKNTDIEKNSFTDEEFSEIYERLDNLEKAARQKNKISDKEIKARLTRAQKYEELRKTLAEEPDTEIDTKELEEFEKRLNELASKLEINEEQLKNAKSEEELEELKTEQEQIKEETKKLKRAYNKRTIKRQGNAQKINTFKNALIEYDGAFNFEPITLTERNNIKIAIRTDQTLELSQNDKKLDTLIANIVENAKEEFEDKEYIERTLLNITNEFYNPKETKHFSEKQLKEVFDLLVKNMTPLYFEYENGEQVIAPLINIQIRKEKPNATMTVRLLKTQYIAEYNKKIKGERSVIYLPNLEDLGAQYKLADSELSEVIRVKYLDKGINRIYFDDLTEYFNSGNRTEKKRFKDKLVRMLQGYADYYQITNPREIKKSSKQKNSETIGLAFRYKK